MTDKQKGSAERRAPAGREAGSETSDLDTLLKEYEDDGDTPKSDRTTLKAVRPILKYVQGKMAEEQEEKLADDLGKACAVLKEAEALSGVDDSLLVGFMEAYARDKPAFRKAFEARHDDPDGWQSQLLKGREWLEDTIDKSFKPKTSDVEAAKAAVRGTTQKADKSDAPDPMELMNMSGVAFEKFLEKERQKAG